MMGVVGVPRIAGQQQNREYCGRSCRGRPPCQSNTNEEEEDEEEGGVIPLEQWLRAKQLFHRKGEPRLLKARVGVLVVAFCTEMRALRSKRTRKKKKKKIHETFWLFAGMGTDWELQRYVIHVQDWLLLFLTTISS